MTDANRLVNASVEGMKAAHTGVQWCDDLSVDGDTRYFAESAAVAVLRELSKRPDDWNRYELADLADEIERENDDRR